MKHQILDQVRPAHAGIEVEPLQGKGWWVGFLAQRLGMTPGLQIKATLVVEKEPPSHIRDLAKRHDIRLVVVTVNR